MKSDSPAQLCWIMIRASGLAKFTAGSASNFHGDEFGEMMRFARRALLDLLSATEAVRKDEAVAIGSTNFRQ